MNPRFSLIRVPVDRLVVIPAPAAGQQSQHRAEEEAGEAERREEPPEALRGAHEVARIGWSKFATLHVTFNGPAKASSRTLLEYYHDSWSYRFGADHTVRSGPLSGWSGRVGYSYAESPAPDETVTPLLPDMNRRNTSFGLGIPFGPKYALDASYLHVNTGGRRGRIVERAVTAPPLSLNASLPVQDLNSGVYELSANVFAVALRANF